MKRSDKMSDVSKSFSYTLKYLKHYFHFLSQFLEYENKVLSAQDEWPESGKHMDFFFNFDKRRGTSCAKVLNSLILKIENVVIIKFAAKMKIRTKWVLHTKQSQITEICSQTKKHGLKIKCEYGKYPVESVLRIYQIHVHVDCIFVGCRCLALRPSVSMEGVCPEVHQVKQIWRKTPIR